MFRNVFTLTEPLADSSVHVFADTRYDLWLDGVWIGRGPARFSLTTREYDVLPIGTLSIGKHILAVRVQWAPNYRRSESTIPMLLAHIQGTANDEERLIARTGPDWKAMLSIAWRTDSPPVHSWNILGPTEELDFNRLPADWMQPAFSDTDWPTAVVVTPTFSAYTPRSIPLLVDTPLTVTVRDAGALSPGRGLGEAHAGLDESAILPFTLTTSAPITIEVLSDTTTSTLTQIHLDGQTLDWNPAYANRPQVFTTHPNLMAGPHQLSFSNLSPTGLPFALSTDSVQTDLAPFQLTVHEGRRTLLADPVSEPAQIAITSGASLDFTFLSPPSYVVLELPRVAPGRLTAEVTGAAGTKIAIGWDERLYPGTSRPLPYPGILHPQWDQVDAWTLDGTRRTLTTIDARAGRYILIAVWGNGPVTFENVRVAEERYPMLQRGQFVSPDSRLNQIWQVGVDTLYANMNDAYADPWRERGQWWGDASVDDRINQAAFGDTRLLRRGLWLMTEKAFDGRPEPLAPNGAGGNMLDYDMIWVHTLADYWRRTNDIAFIQSAYPAVQAFMDYLLTYTNPTTTLLDVPEANWWQTAVIDWAGETSRYGQSTALNAMYYGALSDAAQLAEVAGDGTAAQIWNQRAQLVRQHANELLYQPNEHRYLTSVLNGNPIASSPHAQAWALAYGLAPDGEGDHIATELLALMGTDPASPRVEIYGMYWVLEALGRTGRLDEALTLINRYYGRLLDQGATTWWETFDANQRYTAALSHGWGGSPTWFLTTYILGARQTSPATWAIKPGWASYLTSAAGALPLPSGDLQVTWMQADCATGQLSITAPMNTTGVVIVPFTNPSRGLTLDGVTIWENEASLTSNVTSGPDGLYVSLGAGSHLLVATQQCYANYIPLVFR